MRMIRTGMICLTLLAMMLAAIGPVVLAQKSSPLTKAEVLANLAAAQRREILQADVAAEIEQRGIDFTLTEAVLTELRKAGAKTVVIDALLRAASRPQTRPGDQKGEEEFNTISGAEADNEEVRLPFIEQVRRNALNYVHELPNFIVRQRVRRFTRDPRTGAWQPRDVLDIEVTYETSRGETYQLKAIDGRPTRENYKDVGGASSAGEFGTILVAIFNPPSKATFKQGPNDKIDGRNAVIYDFRVPTETSSNNITETRTGQSIISGYRGSIWIDTETKRVLRIEQAADDIPPNFPITVAESAVDYGFFDISGKQYLLPKRAEVIIGSDRERLYSRNIIEFTDYRKFETDIKIGTPEDE